MPRIPGRRAIGCAASTVALLAATCARPADLPLGFVSPGGAPVRTGGGGFWVPRWPVRPAPLRFDIYGYPILGAGLVGVPDSPALGSGCAAALQPDYDGAGNVTGFDPVPLCP